MKQDYTLPNYTDYDSLLQVFKIHVVRYSDNVFVRYQKKSSNNASSPFEVTMLTYDQVDKITTYLANEWKFLLPLTIADSNVKRTHCVAVLIENNLHSIIAFFTLLKLGWIFFPLSPYNSEEANIHLLQEANTDLFITSETYRQKAFDCCATMEKCHQKVIKLKVWREFNVDQLVAIIKTFSNSPLKHKTLNEENDERRTGQSQEEKRHSMQNDTTKSLTDTFAIFHSSGTTSLPKAISQSTRVFLYRMLEIFIKSIQQYTKSNVALDSNDVIVSPTDFFRIPALEMLIASMLVGSSIFIFNSETLKAENILTVAKMYEATIMASSPIIYEQLAEYLTTQPISEETTTTLQKFKFAFCGGAPLQKQIGDFLRSKGLNVQNYYGMTEAGVLSTSNVSNNEVNDDQWHCIHPIKELLDYVMFEPFKDNVDMYQLVIHSNYPSLSKGSGNRPNGDHATKDLFIEISPGSNIWKFTGRTDDMLLMIHGEMTDPTPIRNEICNEEIIENCLVIGENYEHISVVIELNANKALQYSPINMISKVYDAVTRANAHAPPHGNIAVPDMVYILPLNKKLPITPKGTLIRKKAMEIYCQEIKQLYDDKCSSHITVTHHHSSTALKNKDIKEN
ncbi:hypothetical protein BDC45DRAFT_600824 [Circinella umbellata]|nr:hypothetical protein BDC45DRAFT_600824 [Circinella umbellata]